MTIWLLVVVMFFNSSRPKVTAWTIPVSCVAVQQPVKI